MQIEITDTMKQFFLLTIMLINTVAMSQTYTNISATEFHKQIQQANTMTLDIRTKAEYERGHIPGSILFDTQDPQLGNKLLQLPKDKALYLYCYSGSRSKTIANFLVSQGYTKVYNLERGTIDWVSSGYSLTSSSAAASPQVHAYTIDEYKKAISSNKLVFVDFYAPWCAPCKQMMPMIEELEKEYAGKVSILKVNSDASRELAQSLSLRGVPYLVLYKNGVPVYTKYGITSKQELITAFQTNML